MRQNLFLTLLIAGIITSCGGSNQNSNNEGTTIVSKLRADAGKATLSHGKSYFIGKGSTGFTTALSSSLKFAMIDEDSIDGDVLYEVSENNEIVPVQFEDENANLIPTEVEEVRKLNNRHLILSLNQPNRENRTIILNLSDGNTIDISDYELSTAQLHQGYLFAFKKNDSTRLYRLKVEEEVTQKIIKKADGTEEVIDTTSETHLKEEPVNTDPNQFVDIPTVFANYDVVAAHSNRPFYSGTVGTASYLVDPQLNVMSLQQDDSYTNFFYETTSPANYSFFWNSRTGVSGELFYTHVLFSKKYGFVNVLITGTNTVTVDIYANALNADGATPTLLASSTGTCSPHFEPAPIQEYSFFDTTRYLLCREGYFKIYEDEDGEFHIQRSNQQSPIVAIQDPMSTSYLADAEPIVSKNFVYWMGFVNLGGIGNRYAIFRAKLDSTVNGIYGWRTDGVIAYDEDPIEYHVADNVLIYTTSEGTFSIAEESEEVEEEPTQISEIDLEIKDVVAVDDSETSE